MTFQIEKLGPRRVEVRPELRRLGDKVVASTRWTNDAGDHAERFQVLTIRDGKIADIQGCKSRREAERFAARQ